MEVQIIPQSDINTYAKLFWRTFTQNSDRLRLDFQSKIRGTSSMKPIPLGCYENGALVAATTIFPNGFTDGEQQWLGGQIGDALVDPSQRGKGLFGLMITEAQRVAAEKGYDFLFTFPSVKNPGSYKSFVKNDWQEIYAMSHYEMRVPSGLLGRIIRRIDQRLYLRFEAASIPTNPHAAFDPDWRKTGVYSIIDSSYLDYKQYLTNHVIKLKSGLAYVSLGKFTITLSHFQLIEGFTFENLLQDLVKLAGRLAKDTLTFHVSPHYEKQFVAAGLQSVDHHMKAMVYGLNEELNLDRINFIGSDIDTF